MYGVLFSLYTLFILANVYVYYAMYNVVLDMYTFFVYIQNNYTVLAICLALLYSITCRIDYQTAQSITFIY